ncbi:MAG: prepilin-type N-terminal cleavage/methylation domain-containing protein [Candidatus Omnitrophica bacterium]|nr:prepilin-type N-terminal cleavage/methylation domain-containing protein [Candidatus Omnitrophota bacterium]
MITTTQRRAFTLIEILVVVAIVALLATIAIPHLIRSRMVANETRVIGQLRELANALMMYRVANNAYPDQWQADMYTNADPHYGPEMFNVDMQGAEFIQQGYRYRYADPAGQPEPLLTYALAARPVALNLTGTRTIWVNDTNEIYHCLGESASPTPPANATTISQGPLACP